MVESERELIIKSNYCMLVKPERIERAATVMNVKEFKYYRWINDSPDKTIMIII